MTAACGFRPADVGPDAPVPITVGFQFATSLADELVGTWQVAVVLSEPAPANITVEVGLVGGTAEPGIDFTMDTTQVLFDPGEMMQVIPIPIADDDNEDEGNETIELELRSPVRAELGLRNHQVTISAMPLPRVHFIDATSSAVESIGAVSLVLELTAMPVDDVVIQYGLTGSASYAGHPLGYPADHDLLDGRMLTIPAGSLTFPIATTITPDPYNEFDETAIVTINGISGVIAEGVVTRTHTIENDDPEPIVGYFLQASSVNEPGTATVTVTLSEQSGKPITVDFTQLGITAEPSDFTPATLPVLFSPHVASQDITFAINDDSVDEDDETVDTTLTSALNAQLPATSLRTHTTTIVDEDPSPALDFALASGQIGEAGGNYSVTVTVTPPSPERVVMFDVTVQAGSQATTPADFTYAGSYSVPLGMPSITFPVAIVSDGDIEGNEVFTLELKGLIAAVPGSQTTHACTILDDDPVLVSFDPTEADTMANEGNTGNNSRNFEVYASTPPGEDVTVMFTVTGTALCGPNGTFECTVTPATQVVIQAGTQRRAIQVLVRGDTVMEPDETIILTLTGVSGGGAILDATGTQGPIIRTHTILNDDP